MLSPSFEDPTNVVSSAKEEKNQVSGCRLKCSKTITNGSVAVQLTNYNTLELVCRCVGVSMSVTKNWKGPFLSFVEDFD